MHRNFVAVTIKSLKYLLVKKYSNLIIVYLLFSFLIWILIFFVICESHQIIEVNLDCQKTNLYFQCHVYDLNLFEGDINAEMYFGSKPTQAPNDIRVVNSSIFYVPSHFFKEFNGVKEFVANNCSIHEIYYETFMSASNLQYLGLSFNNIKNIPDYSFRKNSQLQTLKLDHNEIQILPTNAFRGLFTLRLLKLSYNKIKYLPLYLFHDMENLETLELNNNVISVISAGQFITNNQLTLINLHKNSISIIDSGVFDDILGILQQVDLNDNTCVNDIFKNHVSNNLTKLIECCSTSLENMKSCLVSRQQKENESGSGAWIFLIIFIVLGNASLLVYILIKRQFPIQLNQNLFRNQDDNIELTSNIIMDENFSYQHSN